MPDANALNAVVLEDLVAHREIVDVLYRYCQGCDRSDADILRACFHPDAVTDHAGVVIGSWDWVGGALAWLETRVAVTHMVANPLVRIAGHRAISDCHFVAYNRMPKASGEGWEEMIVKGRYLDRFERRDGVWRIAHRIGVHDLERVIDIPESANQVSGERRSGKAPEDPFYSLLADFQAGR